MNMKKIKFLNSFLLGKRFSTSSKLRMDNPQNDLRNRVDKWLENIKITVWGTGSVSPKDSESYSDKNTSITLTKEENLRISEKAKEVIEKETPITSEQHTLDQSITKFLSGKVFTPEANYGIWSIKAFSIQFERMFVQRAHPGISMESHAEAMASRKMVDFNRYTKVKDLCKTVKDEPSLSPEDKVQLDSIYKLNEQVHQNILEVDKLREEYVKLKREIEMPKRGSLIDDFANPNTEPMDIMGGDE